MIPATQKTHNSLGKILREVRIENGLTQEMLARNAGVDRVFLSGLERGRHSPSVEILFRLANGCGVPASVLVQRVEKEQLKRKRTGLRTDVAGQ